jgi:excisionase family DNA binding protein
LTPRPTIQEVAEALPRPLTVTIQQACALTGLSHVTIYKLIKLGKLRSIKIGRRTLVTYASLLGLLGAA